MRLLRGGLVALAVTFLGVAAASFLWPAGRVPDRPAEAIICLGAGMSLQGWELPDSASARRARACAALHAAGAAPLVIFTGYGHEVYSAAQAMADLARAEGLPEAAILVEPRALSTIQNAAFAMAMLPDRSARVIVVSDGFHLPRAWVIFRVLGVRDMALVAAGDRLGRAAGERSHLRRLLRETGTIWANVGRLAAFALGGLAGIDRDTRIAWFN